MMSEASFGSQFSPEREILQLARNVMGRGQDGNEMKSEPRCVISDEDADAEALRTSGLSRRHDPVEEEAAIEVDLRESSEVDEAEFDIREELVIENP